MSKKDKPFDVTELDDSQLEEVAGGAGGIDISCDDDCPNNGCSSGCNPNVVAGCGGSTELE